MSIRAEAACTRSTAWKGIVASVRNTRGRSQMKTKIVEKIRMTIMGIMLAVLMLLGSIETIRAAIYLLLVMIIGFGALVLITWYDDYFVEDGE